jgi:hypothetical protein
MTDTGDWYLRVEEETVAATPIMVGRVAVDEFYSGEWRVVHLDLFDPNTGYHSHLSNIEMHISYDPGDGLFSLDQLDPSGYLLRVVRLMIRRAK